MIQYPRYRQHRFSSFQVIIAGFAAVDLVGGINIGLSFRNVVESAGAWACEVTSVLGARTVTVEPLSKTFTATVTPQVVSIPAANTWVAVSFTA